MAAYAPAGVTPVYDQVIVYVYGGGLGFGVQGVTLPQVAGTIVATGVNVYRLSVGQLCVFTQGPYITTTGTQTWAVVPQQAVLVTYLTPP